MKVFSLSSMLLLGTLYTWASYPKIFAQGVNNSQEAQSLLSPQTVLNGNEEQVDKDPYSDYNKNSVTPIPEPNILFRKRIWREVYLKERRNKPFFSRGKEITKFIVQGVKDGILIPYADEELTLPLTKEQFLENLSLPEEEGLSSQEKALEASEENAWNNKKTTITVKEQPKIREKEYFLPNEITTLELIEDIIFHKVSSTFVHDIQLIKLIIPAEKFVTGLRKTVGIFKYKDLAAYFDAKPKEAIWVNVKNNAGNLKLTEAIELRLFDSRIVKIENPDDLTVDDIYNKGPKESLQASQELEEELIELEQFLWEK